MDNPLVSVIIPTYNHAIYLKKAINSILNQTYKNFEIIVIDDGSTDNTKDIMAEFKGVKYIYQENAGLSAARNNSISFSSGEFLVFLDADDWLYPQALSIQIDYFLSKPNLSLVSGSHIKIYVDENKFFINSAADIKEDNFIKLLKSNYISHPAAVMIRRKIFEMYFFNTEFRSCQDYDLYLSIARNHNIIHHSEIVSAYRLHSSNMSSNYSLMLMELLKVLEKHKISIASAQEKKAYAEGRKLIIDYYTKNLYFNKLRKYKISANHDEMKVLLKYNPFLFIKYLGNSILYR